MDHVSLVNEMLVNTFNEIIDIEQKALITGQFKEISMNDMHIIEIIGLTEPKNMSTVAKALSVTVGTLTIAVNNLVKKGYVARIRSEEDRRVVFLSLTEKGKAAYEHHATFHSNMVREVMEALSEEELDVLVKALSALTGYFHRF